MTTTEDAASAGTLLATRLRVVVELLPQFGLDADAVLARARLSRAALTGPEHTRVPASWEHRLWHAVEAEKNDTSFGLWMAELYMRMDMPSLDGYLARNASSLRAVLTDMDRFAAISDDRLRMELIEHGDLAIIRMSRSPERAQGYVECQFACMVAFCHQYVGPVPLLSVQLRRRKPRGLALYRKAFAGVLPSFDMPHNQMQFPSASLDLAVRGAQPALAGILQAHATSLVERVPNGDSLIARVRAVLECELAAGRIDMDRITHKLALSERTLRRQLVARHTSYKELVDQVRCELACKLLNENESVSSVAERTGFRSTSAFQKAFSRWTQASPSEYRRKL